MVQKSGEHMRTPVQFGSSSHYLGWVLHIPGVRSPNFWTSNRSIDILLPSHPFYKHLAKGLTRVMSCQRIAKTGQWRLFTVLGYPPKKKTLIPGQPKTGTATPLTQPQDAIGWHSGLTLPHNTRNMTQHGSKHQWSINRCHFVKPLNHLLVEEILHQLLIVHPIIYKVLYMVQDFFHQQ